MQASSAQLCQDVCGAFDGLPLHGSHVSDPIEGAQDQDSLHLDDLHELGLFPSGTSDDYPPHSPKTQQQQQQQQQRDPSYKTTLTCLDSSSPESNVLQQQHQHHGNPCLQVQHECSTSSAEHHTDDRQGMKGNTAGCNPAHHDAAMDAITVTQPAPNCSVLHAAVLTHQYLLPEPNRSAQQPAVERDKHLASHGSLSRQCFQPVMHKGGAAITSEELLKAAGEHASLYTQMHSAHARIAVSTALWLILVMLATCHLHPFACWKSPALVSCNTESEQAVSNLCLLYSSQPCQSFLPDRLVSAHLMP